MNRRYRYLALSQLVFRTLFLTLMVFWGTSCASYYQANRTFNKDFEAGNLAAAERTLSRQKEGVTSKDRFLYLVNRGLVASLQKNYKESNEFFEQAYLFGEDYRYSLLDGAIEALVSPALTVYRGEAHEHLLLLYYKALNYLKMGDNERALVECRRLNLRLQQLSDRFKVDNKYRKDAFIHNLMGIIYDADHDYNNAFIAYRNALEIYRTDFQPLFGVTAPEQLKKDLLRTAYLSGLDGEYRRFKKELEMEDYHYVPSPHGDLVFFWHNGLAPIKTEWSINFAVIKGQGGAFFFRNDDYGFDFPFTLQNEEERGGLENLHFFRVAFPRYTERPTYYRSAHLSFGGTQYPLELVEDINAIAHKALQDRMKTIFAKSLLRVALKKVSEKQLREKNEGLGTALGLFNAITERADTRNWQVLPHSISYARVALKEGENKVGFQGQNGEDVQGQYFYFQGEKGKTHFQTFSTMEVQEGFHYSFR